jgi:hypothetical protein
MYNWVPQADDFNSSNLYAIPEAPAGDPLMTLPRYYDINARAQIDTVRQLGEEAAAYAIQIMSVEMEYYDIVCSPTLGPIQ